MNIQKSIKEIFDLCWNNDFILTESQASRIHDICDEILSDDDTKKYSINECVELFKEALTKTEVTFDFLYIFYQIIIFHSN